MLNGIAKNDGGGIRLRLTCTCKEFKAIPQPLYRTLNQGDIAQCECGGWLTDQERGLGVLEEKLIFDMRTGAPSWGVVDAEMLNAIVCQCGAIEFAIFKTTTGFDFTCCRCGHNFGGVQ